MRSGLLALFLVAGCSAITDFDRFRVPDPDAVLRQEDFEYLGAIKLPLDVTFTQAGLTLRIVNGERSFLMTGSFSSGNPVLEIEVPKPEIEPARVKRAALRRTWGDVYQGKRTATGSSIHTFDLEWLDERLFWTYWPTYNVGNPSNPSLGFTDAAGVASGPWSTRVHSDLTHSYVTAIPPTYASPSGPSLGLGGAPYGPSLIAIAAPTAGTPIDQPLAHTTLVQYDKLDRATRPPTYELVPDDLVDQPPRDGIGTFTSLDRVQSSVWIDLPDKRGIIFFTSLATGLVWDGPGTRGEITDLCDPNGTRHAQSWTPRWSIYDPLRFSPAAGVEPAAVREHTGFDPRSVPLAEQMTWGCYGATGGAAFDAERRILYVAYLDAETYNSFTYLPVVYAFRVR